MAASGWVALAAVSFALVPDLLTVWRGNWAFLQSSVIQHESAAVSLLGQVGPEWLGVATGWLLGVIGVGGLVWLVRSAAPRPVVVAAAATLGVWVSPHLLIYDWLMLVVPLVILSTSGSSRIAIRAGSFLAVAALVSSPLESAQLDLLGGWIGIASLSLILVTVVVWRHAEIRATQEAPET